MSEQINVADLGKINMQKSIVFILNELAGQADDYLRPSETSSLPFVGIETSAIICKNCRY